MTTVSSFMSTLPTLVSAGRVAAGFGGAHGCLPRSCQRSTVALCRWPVNTCGPLFFHPCNSRGLARQIGCSPGGYLLHSDNSRSTKETACAVRSCPSRRDLPPIERTERLRTLNLGVLAHVDAGKTTLTERLLYAAGAIDEIGSVDAGTTQTDSLALERQRGITIKSAVVSFVIDDVTVNLIDTPGHPDFIAEVERALSVLDGAVLVISAVEGVQPQTRILMRALQAAVRSDPAVRQQDRPSRRALRALARRDRGALDSRDRTDGLGARARDARWRLRSLGRRRRGVHGQADRGARRTGRLGPGCVRPRRAGRSLPTAPRRARHPDQTSAGPSGVLRLCAHRRRCG